MRGIRRAAHAPPKRIGIRMSDADELRIDPGGVDLFPRNRRIGAHAMAMDSKRRCSWTAVAPGMMAGVPTISRFFGITIAMFFDDHGFPHFHARHAEGEAKVRIDNLEVMDSTLGRRQLRFVLAWAELHQEELEENWRRARAGETLLDIEPLK